MKAGTTVCPEAWVLPRSRTADYLELVKPRVAVLVLFTVAAGALLAARGVSDVAALVHVLCGTALVIAGASALNQWLERHSDARMQRTENRPLPAGRLQPGEVFALGAALGGGGVTYLALALPQPLAAAVAAVALVTYVFLYTPLKHKTTLNTLVGAIPGALPPVIGWTAMRGALGPEIVALFFIVFLWQVPHFLAIAWIYREDYAQAGMRMLPVVDRLGVLTGRQMVNYCLALIPASLAPAVLGLGGPLYAGGAILLGLFFLSRALGFRQSTSVDQARRVLRASLVYLPALFALLLLDGLSALSALAFWP